MSRQAVDDGSYVVPGVFRWGLTQTITLSSSNQQVWFSPGPGKVVMLATDAQGASVLTGSSGGTIVLTSQVVTITSVGSSGTGYAIGDSITLTGGTSAAAPVLSVSAVNTAGAVTAVTITNYGRYTGGLPSNPVSQGTTSGSGSAATFNVSFGSNKRNIPPNTEDKFFVAQNEAIAVIQLGTAGALTISEALP